MMSGYQAFEIPDAISHAAQEPSITHHHTHSEAKGPRAIYLIVGFISSFSLAWLVVVAVFFSFNGGHGARIVPVDQGPEVPFPDAVAVVKTGPVLSVKHSPLLNPGESDFMLFVWFKLRSAIDMKERSTFLGKYDSQEQNPEGYAVALVGGADGVRPHIYWQNNTNKGRWYAFASTQIEPGRWYMLGVTLRAQRYLGVHITTQDPKAQVEVLGGYDLDGQILPASSADLMVGAFKKSKFRGHIGPFGVLRDLDIVKDAPKIMRSFARDTTLGPDLAQSSQVVLWADPVVDRGPLKLPISEASADAR